MVEYVAFVAEIVSVLTDREVWAREGVGCVYRDDRSKKGNSTHGDDKGRER